MPIKIRMSSIMGQIEPENPGLFAHELEKLLNMTLFILLSSTNTNQSAPNQVKMYVIIKSLISWIVDLIGLDLSELSVLEFENLLY